MTDMTLQDKVSKLLVERMRIVFTFDYGDFLLDYNRELPFRHTVSIENESLRLDFVLDVKVLKALDKHVREVSDLQRVDVSNSLDTKPSMFC